MPLYPKMIVPLQIDRHRRRRRYLRRSTATLPGPVTRSPGGALNVILRRCRSKPHTLLSRRPFVRRYFAAHMVA
jgi:hypothetical protein